MRNYAVTFVTDTTGAITAAAVTVTADAGQSKTYGDADPTVAYHEVGLVAGDSFTGVLARDLGENVGTHAITAGNAGELELHDHVPLGVTSTIDQRPITVTAATNTKSYDGDDELVGGPDDHGRDPGVLRRPGVHQTYDTKNVGTGKTLTAAGAVHDGNSGDNYLVTFVNDTTGVITARPSR